MRHKVESERWEKSRTHPQHRIRQCPKHHFAKGKVEVDVVADQCVDTNLMSKQFLKGVPQEILEVQLQ